MSKDEENQELDLDEFLDKIYYPLIPIDNDPGFTQLYKKEDVDISINAGGEIFKFLLGEKRLNYHVFVKAVKRF